MGSRIRYFSMLSVIIVALIVGSVLFFSDKIMAGASDNIRGWIWGENIGWISSNSLNCDFDGNRITDTGNYSECPTGTASVDYGVNVPASGIFSGYGWSENIGWINFAPGGPYPSAPNYSACLDWPALTSEPCNGFGNYAVSGWARSCAVFPNSSCSGAMRPDAERGGWDGWIKLAGNSGSYGVSFDPVAGIFSGWVWGGDDSSGEAIIGWSEVNGVIPPASYPVQVTPLPPEGGNYCNPSGGSKYYPPITLSWNFDGGGGNTQSAYQIQVINSGGATVVDSCPSGAGTCTLGHSSANFYIDPLSRYGSIDFNNTYSWRIRVWGSSGSVSDWVNGANFSTASHRWPNASFTASPTNTLPNRDVVFTNNSTCYNIAGSSVACGSYLWNFGDGATSNATNPVHLYTAKGVYNVQLNATDGLGTCSANANITIRPPLPSWQEVPPTF